MYQSHIQIAVVTLLAMWCELDVFGFHSIILAFSRKSAHARLFVTQMLKKQLSKSDLVEQA